MRVPAAFSLGRGFKEKFLSLKTVPAGDGVRVAGTEQIQLSPGMGRQNMPGAAAGSAWGAGGTWGELEELE